MAFTLDKNVGKGNSTIKVSATKNNGDTEIVRYAKIYVGLALKGIVTLIQKGKDKEYKVFIETDVSTLPSEGGDVKITYWLELNGEVVTDPPSLNLSGNENIVHSERNNGKITVTDRRSKNTSSSSLKITYAVHYGELEATAEVIQEAEPQFILGGFSFNTSPSFYSSDKSVDVSALGQDITLYSWVHGQDNEQVNKGESQYIEISDVSGDISISVTDQGTDSEGRKYKKLSIKENLDSVEKVSQIQANYSHHEKAGPLIITFTQPAKEYSVSVPVQFKNESSSDGGFDVSLKIGDIERSFSCGTGPGGESHINLSVPAGIFPATLELLSVVKNNMYQDIHKCTISPSTLDEYSTIVITYRD